MQAEELRTKYYENGWIKEDGIVRHAGCVGKKKDEYKLGSET
jgi:hypothetical protein